MKRVQRGLSYFLAGVMAASTMGFVWLSAKQFAPHDQAGEVTLGASVLEEREETGPEARAPYKKDPLAGLWMRRGDASLLRFYYFHGNGKGLYRYGRRTLNQTNSFDYRVRNDKVFLRFRKDGQQHETAFSIETDQLSLNEDPKEPGARYRKVAPPMRGTKARSLKTSLDAFAGQLSHRQGAARAEPTNNKGLGSSMWIHLRRFAEGGGEFGMYQFNAPAMDGRGVGWFHRGDFDDWNTESFRYRIEQDRVELEFEHTRRHEQSHFELMDGPRDTRFLLLHQDPRNYWLDRRYRHMGPSFGAHPAFAQWTDLHAWTALHELAQETP